MSTVDRRVRSTTEDDIQGEIQDPRVSTTVDRPSNIKPRIRCIETEYTRLLHPLPSSSYSTIGTKANNLSTSKAMIIVAILFGSSLLILGLLYRQFPQLEESEKQYLKLPWDLEDAKNLGLVLDRYKDKYFHEVLLGVFLVYIFLQTFAIPGSIFLSILSGFLFPFYLALLLVCCCSAIGASLCFFLSNLLGKKVSDSILPNWFINMSAPVIGVPLMPFALGTFIGVAPPSFVAIQAGQTLHTLTSTSDAWSWTSVTVLTIFAFVSLIPVALKHKLKQKFE